MIHFIGSKHPSGIDACGSQCAVVEQVAVCPITEQDAKLGVLSQFIVDGGGRPVKVAAISMVTVPHYGAVLVNSPISSNAAGTNPKSIFGIVDNEMKNA